MSQKVIPEIAVVRIDTGKISFHVIGLDRRGAVVLRQRWSRAKLKYGSPTCRLSWFAWKLASVRTT